MAASSADENRAAEPATAAGSTAAGSTSAAGRVCPVCGETEIRVRLFAREWWECPNSVMEGMLPLRQIREIFPEHVQHNADL